MASIALTAVASAAGSSVAGGLGLGTFGTSLVSGLFDTAAGVLGNAIDSAIFGDGTPRIKGPRLAELKVQTSTYGKTIPIVYGTARIAGNVIWSTDIKEVATTSSASGGGKGGGGGSTTVSTTTFSYFVTLAIAICEGEIDEITRVWADAGVIDPSQSTTTYNIYKGTEDQLPDPIIEAENGVGEVPAYRGQAYVVIEDFPLAKYGNRIPNFTFEVKRKVLASNISEEEPIEDLIKSMVMIPGSGEFVYDTVVQTKVPGSSGVQQGASNKINQHNVSNKADALVALDQLEATCQNLEYVSVIVSWFGDSINASDCTLYPAVEFKDGATTQPDTWSVAGQNRASAVQITLDVNDDPIYGGTPSDASVIKLIQEIKARGYNVIFYPFILMDVVDKPWRGRITGTPTEVSNFFTKTNGYNEFITHYANLVKDDVDAFIIGSEMIGLTKVQDVDDSFPAVDQLVSLASSIKTIVGSGVKVTYAADWSEYHHTEGGWYNMDPLWSSSDIDFVGIDAYFPILDEPQTGYVVQKIIDGWTSGEGYDYIYTDPERTIQEPIAEEFAWKNIQWWWENQHVNPDMNATGWVPQSKKIWFTEYGFPSTDGTANQPNVFFDPESSESAFAYKSKGRVDFRAQRQALTGTELKWKDSNMIERMFVYTWDARPFSFWPDLTNIWSDGGQWKFGHWVQGKIGLSGLAAIVEDLVRKSGLTDGDFDVSRLTDLVEGFVLTDRTTARDLIETLQQTYFFDAVESDGLVKFVPRGEQPIQTVEYEELIPSDSNNARELLNIKRIQELDLPQKVDVNYISVVADYNTGNQHSQRQFSNSLSARTINLPIVLSDQQAKTIADITLFNSWVGRTRYDFSLPLKYMQLEPTDVITVNTNRASHTVRITKTYFGKPGVLQVNAVAEDVSSYDFFNPSGSTGGGTGVLEDGGPTNLEILDLPPLPSDESDTGFLHFAVAGTESAWEGTQIFRSDDGGDTYFPLVATTEATVIGSTEDVLGDVSLPNNFDNANSVTVILLGGELESVSELSVLNGSNAAVVGDEIIQFKNATLIEPNKYRLSGLLRGRLGTEGEISNHQVGDRFVLINSFVPKLSMPNSLINLPRKYKPVTSGQTLLQTTEEDFTYSANALKPFSPVHISGNRDSSNNLEINWIRRARIGGQWLDNVDAQLGETSENYEIDILDGPEIVRTIADLTSPQATYSVADQIVDFGSAQSSIDVNIYQLSSVVGRGKVGIATV